LFQLHPDLFQLHPDLFQLHPDLFQLHPDLFQVRLDLFQVRPVIAEPENQLPGSLLIRNPSITGKYEIKRKDASKSSDIEASF
jgi:hypothetical protein